MNTDIQETKQTHGVENETLKKINFNSYWNNGS